MFPYIRYRNLPYPRESLQYHSYLSNYPLFDNVLFPTSLPGQRTGVELHGGIRDFVNTCLLVHKHVEISVDERILETTRPHKHVTIFGIFFVNFLLFRTKLEAKYYFLSIFQLLLSHFLIKIFSRL